MNKYITRLKFLKILSVLSLSPAGQFAGSLFKKKAPPHIGFLSGAGVMHLEKAFTDELEKLGYKPGENILIEMRLARPATDDVAAMAAELVGMNLSLIVSGSLPIAMQVRKLNPKMPMVLVTCPGMVSNGFAHTLDHPGGIYTGIDELPPGVTAKRLQLLTIAVPAAKRIAVIAATPGTGGHETQLAEALKEAALQGVEVKPFRATNQAELNKALQDILTERFDAMLIFQGALTLVNRQMLVDFARQHKLPVMYQATVFAELGGLMAWAPDLPLQFREAAHYADKILKGARPGDLPVKHPEKYYLTLNKNAAKELGLSFPKVLLDEAVTVIQ